MKTKVDGIVIDVSRGANGVEVFRKNGTYFHKVETYLNVTPSSLRRAQRAQLALVGDGRVNSSAVNADILAALEAFVEKHKWGLRHSDEYKMAVAVIAKAKGQESGR